jgi:hypothetical protein
MPQSLAPLSTSSTQTSGDPIALPGNGAKTEASTKEDVPSELPANTSASRFAGRGWIGDLHVPQCFLNHSVNPKTCVHDRQVVNSKFTSPGWHTAVDPSGDFVLLLPDSTLEPSESKTSTMGDAFDAQEYTFVLTVDGDKVEMFVPEEELDVEPPQVTYYPGEEEQSLTWIQTGFRPHAGPKQSH